MVLVVQGRRVRPVLLVLPALLVPLALLVPPALPAPLARRVPRVLSPMWPCPPASLHPRRHPVPKGPA